MAEYIRPRPGNHPPLDFPPYTATALRHPKRPLVLLPHRLTEVTGPLLGDSLITMQDADLTTRYAGEPPGQRIIVFGRVLGERCFSTCDESPPAAAPRRAAARRAENAG